MSKAYIECPLCGRRILESRSATHFFRVHDQGYIILKSKKGVQVEGHRVCNGCQKTFKVLWMFEQTNRGVVYLCPNCVGIAKKRSFKNNQDVLDAKGTLVNSFEKNPRNH